MNLWGLNEISQQEVLGYKEWRNFERVIDTAKIACQISQHQVSDHFVEVTKIIRIPLTVNDKKKSIGFVDVNKTDTDKIKKIKDTKTPSPPV